MFKGFTKKCVFNNIKENRFYNIKEKRRNEKKTIKKEQKEKNNNKDTLTFKT